MREDSYIYREVRRGLVWESPPSVETFEAC